jgi:tetratricopeptide (TPR) repeat protein
MSIKLITTFVWAICFFSSIALGQEIIGKSNQLAETDHLEFAGSQHWDYEIIKQTDKKSNSSYITFMLDSISKDSIERLTKTKSRYIQKIEIEKNKQDNKDLVKVYLVSEDVEYFDYLTDQPTRMVVDFFLNPKVAANRTSSSQKNKDLALTPKKIETTEKNLETSRKPASDILSIGNLDVGLTDKNKPRQGIFDAADPNYDRFKIKEYQIKNTAAIEASQRVYIDFPILKSELNYLEKILQNRSIYNISKTETDENKQARLLLKLFENKRYLVFFKTLDWFLKKYPQSQYNEIISFMRADAHFALWQESQDLNEFDSAMTRYREAISKFPNSAMVERTRFLMGLATLDRGDYLGAIRLLQSFVEQHPQTKALDEAKIAISRAFEKISKFNVTIEKLVDVEKNSKSIDNKAKAFFAVGDAYLQDKKYIEAIESYSKAFEKYGSQSTMAPNAYFNYASAFFKVKEYRKSLEAFQVFLEKFPSHPYTAYAMTRAGEMLDLLGADSTKVVGAYLETYFRFGNSPAALVARLRLLSLRMPTMQENELKQTISELKELSEKSDLDKIKQFYNLMLAEGYSRRKQYGVANDLLIKYYQVNPTTADKKVITEKIVKYINDEMFELAEKNDFLKVFDLKSKYENSWLKNTNRIDTNYFVAKAFESAGVPAEAEKLYVKTVNELLAIKGKSEEKEREIIEHLPNIDEAFLRLSHVRFQGGEYSSSLDALKSVKNPEKLNIKLQIERVYLAAKLYEKKGDLNTASRYISDLIREWSGQPGYLADAYLYLGQIEERQGNFEDAIKSYQKVSYAKQDSDTNVSDEVHIKAMQNSAKILTQIKKFPEAIQNYEKMLSEYEKEHDLSEDRYKLGQLYFQTGERKKAADTWDGLKNNKNPFWHKMAQEKLQHQDWLAENKKYVQRIPAMADGPKSTSTKPIDSPTTPPEGENKQ